MAVCIRDGLPSACTNPTDFQTSVKENAEYILVLQESLGLTDFNPLTVDWTKPVAWGNDPSKCDAVHLDGEDSGCLMPRGAGMCVRPPVEP